MQNQNAIVTQVYLKIRVYTFIGNVVLIHLQGACSPLGKNVVILVVNTVSTIRVMKSMETVCLVVRLDFMVINVTKVGFIKNELF